MTSMSKWMVYLLLIPLLGCQVQYSFTGINVDAETISINNFFNDAEGGPANLGQVFTDEIREYFQQNTNLNLVDAEGDLLLEGSVIQFKVAPSAPQAGATRNEFATSAQTRLTIVVKVAFTNKNNDEFDFDKNFSFFAEYESSQSLADVEEDLILEIYDQIILNIFNESVANW